MILHDMAFDGRKNRRGWLASTSRAITVCTCSPLISRPCALYITTFYPLADVRVLLRPHAPDAHRAADRDEAHTSQLLTGAPYHRYIKRVRRRCMKQRRDGDMQRATEPRDARRRRALPDVMSASAATAFWRTFRSRRDMRRWYSRAQTVIVDGV
ncbi:hypothetical protein WOLCODRAFT_135925 [Wolfiporia cocos MD-104 SS10]|uniref:Uncharacterized protein n=1 Tax=Wolfiporia cocos (strain MD-104) TaxID=742152 RepID=A0A2H3J7K4_WOLCO|nr:hypothetical protein WOLCODRAFT_135925 [Wolfiporia cocos MD-104 SS10]